MIFDLKYMKILVTGGAGFIGSNFIHYVFSQGDFVVANVDALTYAGKLSNIGNLPAGVKYLFFKGSINDAAFMNGVFASFGPDVVVNFAAESHVDRSIVDASPFVETNVKGVQVLLDACRRYGVRRFCQVSTDEVYGSLGEGVFADECFPLNPSSPYAASKAAADLLVLSYYKTYGLDVVVTRCSNNYGPRQHEEKFIPTCVMRALRNNSIPIYGNGKNVRDWIFVLDHCEGIWMALMKGVAGEIYNFGGDNQWPNIDVACKITSLMGKTRDLVSFVGDRLGHDFRYALDCSKAKKVFGWEPRVSFEDGLKETIAWYESLER